MICEFIFDKKNGNNKSRTIYNIMSTHTAHLFLFSTFLCSFMFDYRCIERSINTNFTDEMLFLTTFPYIGR